MLVGREGAEALGGGCEPVRADGVRASGPP